MSYLPTFPNLNGWEPFDVFIIHTGAQKHTEAATMKHHFDSSGLSCFLDMEMRAGADGSPTEKMEFGLETCRHAVVILSKEFLEREAPKQELAYAFRRMKEIRKQKNKWESLWVILYHLTVEDYKQAQKKDKLLPDELCSALIVKEYPGRKYASWPVLYEELLEEIREEDRKRAKHRWALFFSNWSEHGFLSASNVYGKKASLRDIYRQAERNAKTTGHPLEIKVDGCSHPFDPHLDFAGLVLLPNHDAYDDDAFHLLIQRSPSLASSGSTHESLFTILTGVKISDEGCEQACFFSVRFGVLVLNCPVTNRRLLRSESALIRCAIVHWKKEGPNTACDIPPTVKDKILYSRVPSPVQMVLGGGWRFHYRLDNFGKDLRGPTLLRSDKVNMEKLRGLAREAETYPLAVAFNSIGCIKYSTHGHVANTDAWKSVPKRLRGLFTRDENVPAGWMFLPNLDSQFNDLCQIDISDDDNGLCEILVHCGECHADEAIAFNTDGWLKKAVVENLVEFDDVTRGLYVRF